MKKEENKELLMLSNEETVKTFGGYAPPEGWWDDIFNPPTVPDDPKPLEPIIYW